MITLPALAYQVVIAVAEGAEGWAGGSWEEVQACSDGCAGEGGQVVDAQGDEAAVQRRDAGQWKVSVSLGCGWGQASDSKQHCQTLPASLLHKFMPSNSKQTQEPSCQEYRLAERFENRSMNTTVIPTSCQPGCCPL